MILVLYFIRRTTAYEVGDAAFRKLALIATVAAQVNLLMLGSELFKEFYYPTEHGASARYLFFGLHGHSRLVPWIWSSVALNLLATAVLTLHPLRRDRRWLTAACAALFVAIWMEKGIGLIIPGFIPSPLGEIVEYFPTGVELAVTAGIWALGLFVLTVLIKVALPIELGRRDALAAAGREQPRSGAAAGAARRSGSSPAPASEPSPASEPATSTVH